MPHDPGQQSGITAGVVGRVTMIRKLSSRTFHAKESIGHYHSCDERRSSKGLLGIFITKNYVASTPIGSPSPDSLV